MFWDADEIIIVPDPTEAQKQKKLDKEYKIKNCIRLTDRPGEWEP